MISLIATLALSFILRIRFPSHRSINTTLRNRYDNSTYSIFQELEKTHRKLSKIEQDLRFLTHCQLQNIFPKFLRFKLYKKSLHSSEVYLQFQRTLLLNEIESKSQELLYLNKNLSHLKSSLHSRLSFFDYHAISFFISRQINKLKSKIIKVHNNKLTNLGVSTSLNSCQPEEVIFNHSSRQLSPRENFLLSFGLHFHIPDKKFNSIKHFTFFENLANNLRSEPLHNSSFDHVCDSIKLTARSLLPNNRKVKHPFIFKKADYDILNNLKLDKSIVITRLDKGRGVVILDKSDYISKMNDILSDNSKFVQLPNTTDIYKLALKEEDSINRFLLSLHNKKFINKALYYKIKSTGSSIGVMYGLPKVHKANLPLRPVLAAYNTPSYCLAKYLVTLLEPFTINQYTVPNSYSFCNFLSSQKPNSNVKMASYDIVSLFTNIPIDQTITLACDLAFEKSNLFHGFDRVTFFKLLQFASKNTSFIFNNSIYQQIDGVAMGSPLGPTLANLFLCFNESKWLNQCPIYFKPIIYKRYVDDTFTCFSDSSHLDQFLNYMNHQHPNIKFTIEPSIDNSLSFLDTKISLRGTSFSSEVFRKSTFTGLGTNFHSFIFSNYKINSIKTLIHRAFHLSSSYLLFNSEIEFLKAFFVKNCYPVHYFHTVLRNFLNSIHSPKPPKITALKKTLFCSLPFYGSFSESQYTSLFASLSLIYPHINFRPVLKSFTTIGSYFPVKDSLPNSVRSCAIYKFTCGGCSATYVGSTRRRTYDRYCEHLGISNRTGKALISPAFSHIYKHSIDANHPISFDNFKVLSNFPQHLLIIGESISILKHSPILNYQSSATPLYVTNSSDL